jgi:hypothetical protein
MRNLHNQNVALGDAQGEYVGTSAHESRRRNDSREDSRGRGGRGRGKLSNSISTNYGSGFKINFSTLHCVKFKIGLLISDLEVATATFLGENAYKMSVLILFHNFL